MNIIGIAIVLGPVSLGEISIGEKIVEWLNARLPDGLSCALTTTGDELRQIVNSLTVGHKAELSSIILITSDEAREMVFEIQDIMFAYNKKDKRYGTIAVTIGSVLAIFAVGLFLYFMFVSLQQGHSPNDEMLGEAVNGMTSVLAAALGAK